MYIKLYHCGKFLYVYDYQRKPINYDRSKKVGTVVSRFIDKSVQNRAVSLSKSSGTEVVGRRLDNLNRASRKLSRIIVANNPTPEDSIFVTLTYKENVIDIKISRRHLDLFIKKMKYYDPTYSSISVIEFQRRGAIHYHCIVKSSRFNLSEKSQRNRRDIQSVFEQRWVHGFVKVKYLYGHPSFIANYLTKYFIKSYSDSRLKGVRLYTVTRNVIRPREFVLSDRTYSMFACDVSVPEIEATPVFHKLINSVYLGKCNFYIFNVNSICNLISKESLPVIQLQSKEIRLTLTQQLEMVKRYSPYAYLMWLSRGSLI